MHTISLSLPANDPNRIKDFVTWVRALEARTPSCVAVDDNTLEEMIEKIQSDKIGGSILEIEIEDVDDAAYAMLRWGK